MAMVATLTGVSVVVIVMKVGILVEQRLQQVYPLGIFPRQARYLK